MGLGGGAGGGGGVQGRHRPPSSATSLRPLSSSPSLLSLDNSIPTSPTTTAQTSFSAQLPAQHRHSAAAAFAQPNNNNNNNPNFFPPRSHSSLPASAHSSSPNPNLNGRHQNQLERVYGDNRYDAEFDRGTSSRQAPPTTSTSRALFNPDTAQQPVSSSSRRDDRDPSGAARSSRRSKRDQVDPSDVGGGPKRGAGKDSRESLESEEYDASGRPASRSSKESKNRRKREEGGRRRDRDEQEVGPGGSSTSLGREPPSSSRPYALYDPKKDDPIKFPSGRPSSSKKHHHPPSVNDNRSFVSSVATSDASSAASRTAEEPPLRGSARRTDPDTPPFVMELKRAYRDITDAETKLQEEHRAALAAAVRDDDAASGLRIQSGAKKLDDDFWVMLANGHKQLADAHYSFLQMALDPRHPASLHSLPAKYNIPTRLWQTGFHQLLERMRHAVSSPPPAANDPNPTNVLEHLVEFIQYAYGFYSQLYEDPTVALFRPAWIEQLGDLARYRMAVAGLANRVSSQGAQGRGLRDGDLEGKRLPRPADAASIGDAALGDWDVEEQETWKASARDWYSQGVAETPGTGRLQHHLALLSKGDEMRGLYHYVKSLTAAHPYVSARESILPLFEDEHQARRTQPDVTKAELFVHLHGMLFTKIALDDFDACLGRFLERLTEEGCRIGRSSDWAALGMGTGPLAPFGDAEWSMVAVINISALLQYGAEDGVLKKNSSRDPAPAPSSRHTPSSSVVAASKARTPQAIMLNPSSLKRADTPDEGDDDSLPGDTSPRPPPCEVVMQLGTSGDDDSDDPLAFRLAQRLAFSTLELALVHPFRVIGDAKLVNPYLILLLTFLANVAQHPAALRHLERSIPWARIVGFLNSIPSSVDVRLDVQSKLVGNPLPEDWCIRGMDWTGKHIFGRGYWKTKSSPGGGGGRRDDSSPPIGPSSNSIGVESEMDALKFKVEEVDDYADDEEGTTSASVLLARERWRRVATLGAWLARSVPGLDLGPQGKFVISGALEGKLGRWKREEEDAKEAERQSRAMQWARDAAADAARVAELEESTEDEDDDDDDEDPADSEVVKELKARRRELKAIVRQARQLSRPPIAAKSRRQGNGKRGRPTLSTFPGFTVLVFDTNILLASLRLFRNVVETETWTVVVPLAVVTELDGLKKNPTALGIAAEDAVAYLESAIKQRSRHLKVQTSRGNYLKDLSIRSESIDFAGTVDGFSHDLARSMDDVILRAVAWQQDHFSSRLALVNPWADPRAVPADASHVVLVTFDRNLRLKARARGLDATDEKGLGMLLETKDNG